MSSSRPECLPTPSRAMLTRICDRASRVGVWLLPLFYMSFFAMLLLIWRAPGAALWLPAVAAVLAGTMGVWALLFLTTSRLAPLPRAAGPANTARRAGKRITPIRSTHMPTRPCAQACGGPDGARTQFMVACFHANCAAAVAKTNADGTAG